MFFSPAYDFSEHLGAISDTLSPGRAEERASGRGERYAARGRGRATFLFCQRFRGCAYPARLYRR